MRRGLPSRPLAGSGCRGASLSGKLSFFGKIELPRRARAFAADPAVENDLGAASNQRQGDHDQTHARHAPAGQFKDSHQGASARTLPGTSIHREPGIRKHFPSAGLDDRGCVERGVIPCPSCRLAMYF